MFFGAFLHMKRITPGSSAELPIFLTTKEAARLLKVTTRFLYNLVENKKGPPMYKLGERFRFKQSDLLQWFEQNRV